jgi:hypothetical protein
MPDAAPAQSEPPVTKEERAQWDLVQQSLFNLTPFFLDGAGGDAVRARAAAFEMIKAFPCQTMLELQLVTEIIAFSQSAIDNLRRAKADPELPDADRDKLRTKAVAMNAAEHRTVRTLEKVYQSRRPKTAPQPAPPPPQAEPDPVRDQAAILRDVQDRVAQYRAYMAAHGPGAAAAAPGNRDQRHAAERDAGREARRAAG